MATYQDIHRIIKETIQVDADPNKRWTPQIVKFINHENEFYGTFNGKIDVNGGLSASNCSLSNVNLSSCRIYDLSGNELDLNTIFPEIHSIRDRVDAMSVWVYHDIPQRIDSVHGYVDEVSSGISVLMDEKIEESWGQTSKDLSTVSAYLQSEIDIQRSQINEISSKIKGGVVYKGIVSTCGQRVKMDNTLSSLLLTNEQFKADDEIRSGFMYVNRGHLKMVEGHKIGNGDYIYVNIDHRGVQSIKIREIQNVDVDILDAMDSDVYTLINIISNDVEGLGRISAIHEGRIASLESNTSVISTNLESLSGHVYGMNGTTSLIQDDSISIITEISQNEGKVSVKAKELLSSDITVLIEKYVQNEIRLSVESLDYENNIEEGKLIKHLSEKDGVISVETTEILSNYVVGLSDYVNEQIKLSVKAFDSEISSEGKVAVKISMVDGRLNQETSVFDRIKDDYIQEISQSKITNLTTDLFNISSELSTIYTRNRGDVSLMGNFKYNSPNVENLTHFLHAGTEKGFDYILRKGFMYHLSSDQTLSSDKSGEIETKTWNKNYYVIVKDHIILSDASFESFYYIKDYDGDIKILNDRIDNLDVEKISVENGYIFDSIWENEGKISATSRKLVSSDVSYLEDYVKEQIRLSVEDISGEYSIEECKTVESIKQSNGKLEITSRDILSSYVKGLSNYVENEINLSVSNILTSISIPEGKTITSITQENGLVSVLTSNIISSHVIGLSDYIKNEIERLDVGGISGTNKFISKVWETDGKISAETRSITNDDITEGLISQNKITNLTSDLSNIISEISGTQSDISTVSSDLNEKLSVTVEVSSTSNTGCLSSYYIKQGNETVGCTIDIPNQIWIEDHISSVSCYSNLSVFKLTKEEYENQVTAQTLLSNGLYIVDSDYIDAYGQQICSLTMSDNEPNYKGIAATKPYVDKIKTAIVTSISSFLLNKPQAEIQIQDIFNSLSSICDNLKNI